MRAVRQVIAKAISRVTRDEYIPVEFTHEDIEILKHVRRHRLTMSSPERMYATLMAARYVCENEIPGDFVECGVWRGGNALLAADVFHRMDPTRQVYLFDTFAGMTAPTENDVNNRTGAPAMQQYQATLRHDRSDWCFASLHDVLLNFEQRGLSCKPIVGDVLQTLRCDENVPTRISVLRLDTDWYESTLLELQVLYPRLQRGGVLVLDDYGHWGGAKKALDEYFAAHAPRPLLACSDYTGRIGVKVD